MKSFSVGGVEMRYPIIVGAGACKTPSSILPYMREDVPIGVPATGSYTPDESPGNEGTLFYPNDYDELQRLGIGVNSLGMPNMSNKRAADDLERYSFMRPPIVSIAGSSVDDYVSGVKTFDRVPSIAAIKLNFGCPNRHDKRKIPIGHDPELREEILRAVNDLSPSKPIWVKESQYPTKSQIRLLQVIYPQIDFSNAPTMEDECIASMFERIGSYRCVRAVVIGNTLGNVILRDENGNPVTTPNNGMAGLSGKITKYLSMSLILEYGALIAQNSIDVVASGGVMHGDDGVDYLEQTVAKAFCCTSGPFWYGNGPRFFVDLLSESERLQNYIMQHSQ